MNFVAEPCDMDSGDVGDAAEDMDFGGIGNENEAEAQNDIPTDNDSLDSNGTVSVNNPTAKRGRKRLVTPRLAAALDNAKVSDGMAIHILIAAAEALGHKANELVINRSSLVRQRQMFRADKSQTIQANFFRNVI